MDNVRLNIAIKAIKKDDDFGWVIRQENSHVFNSKSQTNIKGFKKGVFG
jgi:hypothetical protein